MTVAAKNITNEIEYKEEIVLVMPVLEKEGEYSSLPKEHRNNTRKISSQFKVVDGRITSNIIKGLSRQQERIFLTEQLGISVNNANWEKEINKFWSEYFVLIPERGLKLNKATYLKEIVVDGEKVKIDYPYNMEDYIRYNFIMESSQVAKTPDQKSNMDLFMAYIEDYSEVKKKQVSLLNQKDTADKNYVDLINNKNQEEKINWLIERFRQPEENFVSYSLDDKKLKLREIKDNNPIEFNAQFENPNLEQEAFIYQLVTFGLLRKEGKLYFNGVENLGSYSEAIEYMKKATNSENVAKFKALLEQKMKEQKNIR